MSSCVAQSGVSRKELQVDWIAQVSDALYWSCSKGGSYGDACTELNVDPTWSFYSKVRAIQSLPIDTMMVVVDSIRKSHLVLSDSTIINYTWNTREGAGYALYNVAFHLPNNGSYLVASFSFSDCEIYLDSVVEGAVPELPDSILCGSKFSIIAELSKGEISSVSVSCYE